MDTQRAPIPRTIKNVMTVGKGGHVDHTTIQAANDSGVVRGMSAANPFEISVQPGIYVETVILSPGASLVGTDREACVIRPASGALLLQMSSNTVVANLFLDASNLTEGQAVHIGVVDGAAAVDDVRAHNVKVTCACGVPAFASGDMDADLSNISIESCEIDGGGNPLSFVCLTMHDFSFCRNKVTGHTDAGDCMGLIDAVMIGNIAYRWTFSGNNIRLTGVVVPGYMLRLYGWGNKITDNVYVHDVDLDGVAHAAGAVSPIVFTIPDISVPAGERQITPNIITGNVFWASIINNAAYALETANCVTVTGPGAGQTPETIIGNNSWHVATDDLATLVLVKASQTAASPVANIRCDTGAFGGLTGGTHVLTYAVVSVGSEARRRMVYVVDSVPDNLTRYVANGGLGATGGYQFGTRVRITRMWLGSKPHAQSADATLTAMVYKAAATTAVTLVISQDNAIAWTPFGVSGDFDLIFEPAEYFGLRLTSNNATGDPTWYRPTVINRVRGVELE